LIKFFELFSAEDGRELQALIDQIDWALLYSVVKQTGSRVCNHHKSFEAHDFKIFVQYAPFVFAAWSRLPGRAADDLAQDYAALWIPIAKMAKELWSRSFLRARLPGLHADLEALAVRLVAFSDDFRTKRKLHNVKTIYIFFISFFFT